MRRVLLLVVLFLLVAWAVGELYVLAGTFVVENFLAALLVELGVLH